MFYCTKTHKRYNLVKVYSENGEALDTKTMRRYTVKRQWV